MTFVSTLALGVALWVLGPYLAHKIRRWRANEEWFPAARLVSPVASQARRRSRLEQPGLLAVRIAQVLALALLGATPFVRCSKLSLQRPGGASIAMAIVIDDSMSMRADADGKSRFERARSGARDLLASAAEGDAVTIVLAGAPARVAVGATTDLSAALQVVNGLSESDRPTDLEGSLALADGLLGPLPQPDKRIVLLSDLADGHADGAPLVDGSGLPVWAALPEIRGSLPDCGLLSADRRGNRVHVSVICGPQQHASGREVVVEDSAGNALARATVDPGGELTIVLSADAKADRVRLLGKDAISYDDVAPVVAATKRGAIAVVEDSSTEATVTGGPPAVEQALEALRLDEEITPIPAVPDSPADLGGDLGVVLDDPPGMTPEQRQALGAFLKDGGVVLLALGERAAAEPLGATLEPILAHAVSWSPTQVSGASVGSALGPLTEGAETLSQLGAPSRAILAPDDVSSLESMIKWKDGAPLVGRRSIGRGEAWIVTLPLSIEASDLPLRPGFLSLLGSWSELAGKRASVQRTEVGAEWKFDGVHDLRAQGPSGLLEPTRMGEQTVLVPPTLGAYQLTVDGRSETRVAMPSERELDLRPRDVVSTTVEGHGGDRRAPIDASPYLALAVLALVASEMGLRAIAPSRSGGVG